MRWGWQAQWLRARSGAVLALAVWGALKVPAENRLEQARREVVGNAGFEVDGALRDRLGQGAMMAVLGGFRGVVASFIWAGSFDVWRQGNWARLHSMIETAALLQPRNEFFWRQGALTLAIDLSMAARDDPDLSPLQRKEREEHWIAQGLDFVRRGIQANPDSAWLWQTLAYLLDHRARDYLAAAEAYREALRRPGHLAVWERFPGHMLDKAAERDPAHAPAAYQFWRDLWLSSDEHPPGSVRFWERVEERVRFWEDRLDWPQEKRLFPQTEEEKARGSGKSPR